MPPTTLSQRNNVECPACESILTRCRGGGRSDEGYRIRRRICDDCGLIFCTAEVAVMYEDGRPVPLTALDSEHRWYHRQEQRRRVKYNGTRAGRMPYAEPARLSIRVKVSEPVRRAA